MRRVFYVAESNWPWVVNHRAPDRAASAKRAGLGPFAYLPDLLRPLPSNPHSRIGEVLPNVWNKFKIQSA